MKSLIPGLFTFFLTFYSNISPAQFIAGSVPAGTSIQYPNIFLSDSTIGSPVSDSLDLDCDNIKDLAIDLRKGNVIVDGAHTIWLRNISNTIEVWRDSIYQHENMIPFYQFGDTMCNDGFQWMADSTSRFACGGGFCWGGIHQATDVYFAFRSISTQQAGWIKITFNLQWVDPVTTSITEVLVLCTGNGIEDASDEPIFTIAPNPSSDGKIKLHSVKNITRIEITNAIGLVVKIIQGVQTEILLPEEQGLYLIRATDEKGKYYLDKVWRQ